MKRVKVRYYSLFTVVTGILEEEIDVNDGATLRDLIITLERKYGNDLTEMLYNRKGEIRSTSWFLLNKQRVYHPPEKVTLSFGDEVILTLPMLVGG